MIDEVQVDWHISKHTYAPISPLQGLRYNGFACINNHIKFASLDFIVLSNKRKNTNL